MRRALLMLGCGLALLSGPAAAASLTADPADARALARLCTAEERAFCFGYVTAAGQFYQALIRDENAKIAPFVCPGRPVSQTEAVQIFIDWLAAHPDAGTKPAIDGLFEAWVEAFPCNRG